MRADPRVVRRLRRASRIAGGAVAMVGVVVIVGWIAHLTILTSLTPALTSMKFNTAMGLVLVGVSIVSLGYATRPKFLVAGRVAAAASGSLGLATLLEYVSGRDIGFDNTFGFDKIPAHPGRMASTTALCFLVTAIAITALSGRRPRLGQAMGLFVVSVSSLAVIGYAFGVTSLYTVGAYTPMALHTATAFVVAGLAALWARPDRGLVALVTDKSAGGVTVRRMLVPAVVGPAVVGGLLAEAARSGALTPAFRLALFTVAMIVLSTALIGTIGFSLRHIDLRRAGAEDALEQVNGALAERNRAFEMLDHALADLQSGEERFRASVEHLHEALSVFESIRDDQGSIVDFRWEFANAAASLMTGYPSQDLIGKTLMSVLPDHGPSGMFAVYRQVVETGEPYVDPSLWYEDVWGDGRRVRRAFDVRATKIGDGFVVVTREVTQQREQELELARQRFELERTNTEMRLLNGLADMLQSCASADEAYTVVVQSCAALFSGFSGSISVMLPSRDVLDVEGSWGEPVVKVRFSPEDCWALRRGRPYVSGPVGPRCPHLGDWPRPWCLCVPMTERADGSGPFDVFGGRG